MYKATRSNPETDWVESMTSSSTSTRRSELKTPFSDEIVFGINSQIKNWDLGLKWVNRKYQDEISRNPTDIPQDGFNFSYEYGNDGHGEADIYSLTLKNQEPFNIAGTQHLFALGFDYSEIFRSYIDYTSEYKDADQERLISYDGKIIKWADRPATNFNQPWTARISWDIAFDSAPIKVSNFFSYKDSYDDIISNGKIDYNDSKIDSYVASEIKPKFTWDMRTTYDINLGKDLKAILGLTINNVTNRVNTYVTGASSTSSTPRVMTEIGRQFIADVTFKF